MTRYIDADKFYNKLDSMQTKRKECTIDYLEVFEMLNKILTADVVEVKHGYWVEDIKEITPFNGIVPIKALVGYRCSVCNRPEFRKEPYCNCGAKMDERS